MKLKECALLAEVMSAIAVVVTLIFLLFEVRANSDLIRASTFDRNIQSVIDFNMGISSDDEAMESGDDG